MKDILIEIIRDAIRNSSKYLFIKYLDDTYMMITKKHFKTMEDIITKNFNADLYNDKTGNIIISAVAVDNDEFTLEQIMHALRVNTFFTK